MYGGKGRGDDTAGPSIVSCLSLRAREAGLRSFAAHGECSSLRAKDATTMVEENLPAMLDTSDMPSSGQPGHAHNPYGVQGRISRNQYRIRPWGMGTGGIVTVVNSEYLAVAQGRSSAGVHSLSLACNDFSCIYCSNSHAIHRIHPGSFVLKLRLRTEHIQKCAYLGYLITQLDTPPRRRASLDEILYGAGKMYESRFGQVDCPDRPYNNTSIRAHGLHVPWKIY